ncbi:MAG: DUF6285 domain-containing protein [Rhodospirillales bacterium]
MRDRPAGPDLLALVERVENGDPAVTAPADPRYRELLLARAREIAARQSQAGDGPERREQEALSRLLGREGSLADLNRALAAAIREGRFDPGATDEDAVRTHLREATRARVGESNPKALKP